MVYMGVHGVHELYMGCTQGVHEVYMVYIECTWCTYEDMVYMDCT